MYCSIFLGIVFGFTTLMPICIYLIKEPWELRREKWVAFDRSLIREYGANTKLLQELRELYGVSNYFDGMKMAWTIHPLTVVAIVVALGFGFRMGYQQGKVDAVSAMDKTEKEYTV